MLHTSVTHVSFVKNNIYIYFFFSEVASISGSVDDVLEDEFN